MGAGALGCHPAPYRNLPHLTPTSTIHKKPQPHEVSGTSGIKNARFWHSLEKPCFPPPKTPFKTIWVLGGFRRPPTSLEVSPLFQPCGRHNRPLAIPGVAGGLHGSQRPYLSTLCAYPDL